MNSLLDIFALGSVLAGTLVITSGNPVVSVLFLVTVFVFAACYLLTLGVSFVGLTYLIVYVGAVAVLFLFVVMMLNIRVSEIVAVGTEHTKSIPLGIFVGTLFILEFISILPFFSVGLAEYFFTSATAFFLGFSTSIGINHVNLAYTGPIADTGFTTFTQIQSLGQGLYSHGSLSLLLASIVLLLAMIGPILICLKTTPTRGSVVVTLQSHKLPSKCSNPFLRAVRRCGVLGSTPALHAGRKDSISFSVKYPHFYEITQK